MPLRRRGCDAVEEPPQPLDRHQHQVVQAQARQGLQLLARPLHAHRHEALGRLQHRVRVFLAADAPQQALELQPRAAAGRRTACSCGTWTTARGCASCRPCFPGSRRSAARHTTAGSTCPSSCGEPSITQCCCSGVSLYQGVSRGMPAALGMPHEVVLRFGPGRRLDGLDGAGAQRELVVRDHQAEVDADHAAEAAAGLAGAHRRVEGEHRGIGSA